MKFHSIYSKTTEKDTNWLVNIIFGFILSIFFIIFSYLALITTFDRFLPHISIKQEEFIWNYMKASFGFDDQYSLDPEYVKDRIILQNIIDSLPKAVLPKNYTKIEVLVMNDEYINAFAAPSGKLIITTGLLNSLETENGIVFVLGHEIGHFVKKDHLHEFIRVTVAGLFSAMTGSPHSLMVDLLLAIDSEDSRKREYEADQWGLKTLVARYGHAGGANEFFDIISDENEEYDEFLESMSSHPLTSSRIKLVNQAIKENKFQVKKPKFFNHTR